MPPSRPEAAFAARLLAWALAVQALHELLYAWLQARALAQQTAETLDFAARERAFALLDAVGSGSVLLAVLLAGLTLFAARRFGRALGDGPVRALALTAGVCAVVDAARLLALLGLRSPADYDKLGLPLDFMTFMHAQMLAGFALSVVGPVMLVIAVRRSERLLYDRRPVWPLIAAGCVVAQVGASAALNLVDAAQGPRVLLLAGLQGLGAATLVALAIALVGHAARLADEPAPAATARAAAGLERYADATALRLLLVVASVVAVFFLGYLGRMGPGVILGAVTTLGLIGLVTGLAQVAGLVRLAHAPTSRGPLGAALLLIGAACIGECVTLALLLVMTLDTDSARDVLRAIDLPDLGLATQSVGLLGTLTLLLALRRLARLAADDRLTARCTALMVALLGAVAVLAALRLAAPARAPVPPALVAALGLAALAGAIAWIVAFFRLLGRLRAALTPGAQNGRAAIQ